MNADKLIVKAFGIKLKEVRKGQVKLSMTVKSSMVNSQNFCHGGFIFTLADSACAYATASLNVAPATTEANISFLLPAKLGESLNALASVENKNGKSICSTVRILNRKSEVIAINRGVVVSGKQTLVR